MCDRRFGGRGVEKGRGIGVTTEAVVMTLCYLSVICEVTNRQLSDFYAHG